MTIKKRNPPKIYWESNCAICGVLFPHDRMTAVYCGQPCRNKARNFSARMLESLTRKSLLTLQSYKRTTVEEQIAIKGTSSLQEAIDMLKVVGFADKDIKDLLHTTNMQQAKRKLEEQKLRLNSQEEIIQDDKENHTNLVDDEMVNFKLDDEVKDNLKFINKEDPIGGSDGFK